MHPRGFSIARDIFSQCYFSWHVRCIYTFINAPGVIMYVFFGHSKFRVVLGESVICKVSSAVVVMADQDSWYIVQCMEISCTIYRKMKVIFVNGRENHSSFFRAFWYRKLRGWANEKLPAGFWCDSVWFLRSIEFCELQMIDWNSWIDSPANFTVD